MPPSRRVLRPSCRAASLELLCHRYRPIDPRQAVPLSSATNEASPRLIGNLNQVSLTPKTTANAVSNHHRRDCLDHHCSHVELTVLVLTHSPNHFAEKSLKNHEKAVQKLPESCSNLPRNYWKPPKNLIFAGLTQLNFGHYRVPNSSPEPRNKP